MPALWSRASRSPIAPAAGMTLAAWMRSLHDRGEYPKPHGVSLPSLVNVMS
ncbi:MAG TPA: hypothetical protein VGJ18_23970 [Gemmatimonadaceae bacterium]